MSEKQQFIVICTLLVGFCCVSLGFECKPAEGYEGCACYTEKNDSLKNITREYVNLLPLKGNSSTPRYQCKILCLPSLLHLLCKVGDNRISVIFIYIYICMEKCVKLGLYPGGGGGVGTPYKKNWGARRKFSKNATKGIRIWFDWNRTSV